MSDAPPPGYLGADARIRTGPSPEMVAAGYELELADAAMLHHGLGQADIAHVIALAESQVIDAADAAPLLAALLELDRIDPAQLAIDSRYGDLVNVREQWLSDRAGRVAGWLSAGRPRREAGRIAFRLALRERLLDLAEGALRFGWALYEFSDRERATLMPDYTYIVAAQPTTAGHWALSFVAPVIRDLERFRSDLRFVDSSPAGISGVNGSRLSTDRARLTALLGFASQISNTRDAMWQTDGFADLTSHAAIAAVGASRFAEDVELYCTSEFGLLRIGDEHCRASALMPHKRNPYSLVVLRGGASSLIGRSTGVLAAQRTLSGQTDNLLHVYGEVAGSVSEAAKLLQLAGAVAETLEIDAEAAERTLRTGFTQATDLADVITRETDLDYRSAYRIVGNAVAYITDRGGGPERLTAAQLDACARVVVGHPLNLDPDVVRAALDPIAAIATRTVDGGAAPQPIARMLAEDRAALHEAAAWLMAARMRITSARGALLGLAEDRVRA